MSAWWKKKARKQQEFFFDLIGNRRYDFIPYSRADVLSKKVSYALCGPIPDSGYNNEQRKSIEKMSDIITKKAKDIKDKGVYLSILFIVGITEDDNREFIEVVFRLDEKIFIDTTGRVYKSWQDFWKNNEYPKCWYCYPQDGEYQVSSEGTVLLGYDTSPACDLLSRAGKVTDVASTITTIGSGVLFSIGLFTPLAPAILVGAGIAGGASGAYQAVRGGAKLVDRASHEQSISLLDGEARSAWFDVVMGPIAVSAGITTALRAAKTASAASKGIQTAGKAYEALDVLNDLLSSQVRTLGYEMLQQILKVSKAGRCTKHEIEGIRQSMLFSFHVNIAECRATQIFLEVKEELDKITHLIEEALLKGERVDIDDDEQREREVKESIRHLQEIDSGEELLNVILPILNELCNYTRRTANETESEEQEEDESSECSDDEDADSSSECSEVEANDEESDEEENQTSSSDESEEETVESNEEKEVKKTLAEIRDLLNSNQSNKLKAFIKLIKKLAKKIRKLISRNRNVKIRINPNTRGLEIIIPNRPIMKVAVRLREQFDAKKMLDEYGHDEDAPCSSEELRTPGIYIIKCKHCAATYAGKAKKRMTSRKSSHKYRFEKNKHTTLNDHCRKHYSRHMLDFDYNFVMHIVFFLEDGDTDEFIRALEVFFQWWFRSRWCDGGLSRR